MDNVLKTCIDVLKKLIKNFLKIFKKQITY